MLLTASRPGRRRVVFATLALLAVGGGLAGRAAIAAGPPVAGPVSPVTTPEGSAVQIGLTGSDPDGDSLTFEHIDGPAHGDIGAFGAPTCLPGPPSSCEATVTYTPDADYNGPDVFTYQVHDGNGGSDGTEVHITVTPESDPPVAGDDSIGANEDVPTLVNHFTLLANDEDVDPGTTLTITNVDAVSAEGGTIVDNGDETLTYTSPANYSGPDSFGYTLSDGTGGTDTATVTVSVNQVNDPPDAIDDEKTVLENSGTAVMNVVNNDTDVEGQEIEVADASNPDHGTTIVQNGVLRYRPDTNFNGVDTFTYVAEDELGDQDTATVTVTVEAANSPPVASDDSATVDEDTPTAVFVLENDADADGDPLLIAEATDGAHGTVEIVGSGNNIRVIYTPAADFNGSDTFGYTVSDAHGGMDTATVSVTVDPVNDEPVADNDATTGTEDQPRTVNVLNGDTDVDGDTLTIVDTTDGDHGTVAITMAGSSVRYTPAADFFGTDSFTYTISDGQGGQDTATVAVTIGAVNDAPTAGDDGTPTPLPVAQNLGPTPLDVLANDTTSPDIGESLSIVAVTQGANGTVAITGGGTGLTYDPTGAFTGDDAFTYTVSDGVLEATATVHVHVAPDITAPVASIRVVGTASATSSSIRVTVTWSAFELQSGVTLYQLQQQVDGGAWTTIGLSTPTTTSVERVLAGGHAYGFRVRARDGIGNLGAYATAPPVRI